MLSMLETCATSGNATLLLAPTSGSTTVLILKNPPVDLIEAVKERKVNYRSLPGRVWRHLHDFSDQVGQER